MTIYIDEFLYRGRPQGSAEPPAWHLTLASSTVDDFGKAIRGSTRTLNMAEAAAAGWALPDIIAALNADLMAEVDEKRVEITRLQTELAEKDEAIKRSRPISEAPPRSARSLSEIERL